MVDTPTDYRQTTDSCYPIVPGGKSAKDKKNERQKEQSETDPRKRYHTFEHAAVKRVGDSDLDFLQCIEDVQFGQGDGCVAVNAVRML